MGFNELTHSLLVDYHVVRGDARAAADAFHAAEAAGVTVRPASFARLLSRCERSGEHQLLVGRLPRLHAAAQPALACLQALHSGWSVGNVQRSCVFPLSCMHATVHPAWSTHRAGELGVA